MEQARRRYFGISVKDLTLAGVCDPRFPSPTSHVLQPLRTHARTSLAEDVHGGNPPGTVKDERAIPADAIQATRQPHLRHGRHGRLTSAAEPTRCSGTCRTWNLFPRRRGWPHSTNWKPSPSSLRGKISERRTSYSGSVNSSRDVQGFRRYRTPWEQGGLIIETTLDWELQAAEKTVNFQAGHCSTALVRIILLWSLSIPETKEVLAYVENTDYSDEVHEERWRGPLARLTRIQLQTVRVRSGFSERLQSCHHPARCSYEVR